MVLWTRFGRTKIWPGGRPRKPRRPVRNTNQHHDTLQDGCHTPYEALRAVSCSAAMLTHVFLPSHANQQQHHSSYRLGHQHKQNLMLLYFAVNTGTPHHSALSVPAPEIRKERPWPRPVVQCCCWCITAVVAQRRLPVQMCGRWAAGRCTAARASCSRLRPAIPH